VFVNGTVSSAAFTFRLSALSTDGYRLSAIGIDR
jgi:hypothetical protein